MAVNQVTTNNQALFFEEDAGGRYYIGFTKAELVGTGKFKPEWFPRNNKKSMVIEADELLLFGFDPLIVKVEINRFEGGRGLFDVAMFFSDKEAERRSQIKIKELEEQAYKEASELAKGWIDRMPNSVDAFKKQSAWLVDKMMTINFNEGSGSKNGGYSFDKKTVREFDLAVEAACNILLKGEVKFHQIVHEQRIRELATDAFSRGICLSFTGHQRNAMVQRFLDELAVSKAETAHV